MDIEDWIKGLENIVEDVGDVLIPQATHRVANVLLDSVVEKTPTGIYPVSSGKQGGFAKRNWQISKIVKSSDKCTIKVYNNTYYIIWLEYGHRARNFEVNRKRIPGKFMLTKATREVDEHLEEITSDAVNKFFTERGF